MAGKKARKPADGSYSTAWRNVSKIILRPGISLMMGLDFAGMEHIPAEGPVILAANHLSYMDIFAVARFADRAGRYPVFLAKSTLFDIPVLGPVIGKPASCRSTAARPTQPSCCARPRSWSPRRTRA